MRQQCPACPDGYVWNGGGPTTKFCPVCKGCAFVGDDEDAEREAALTELSAINQELSKELGE